MDITKVYLQPNEQDQTRQNSVTRQLLEWTSAQASQRSVTSASTIKDSDAVLTVNSTSSITYTLPNPTGRTLPLTIKDAGGNALNANITVSADSTARLVDGSTGYVISTNYGAATFNPFNDGVNTGWFVT